MSSETSNQLSTKFNEEISSLVLKYIVSLINDYDGQCKDITKDFLIKGLGLPQSENNISGICLTQIGKAGSKKTCGNKALPNSEFCNAHFPKTAKPQQTKAKKPDLVSVKDKFIGNEISDDDESSKSFINAENQVISMGDKTVTTKTKKNGIESVEVQKAKKTEETKIEKTGRNIRTDENVQARKNLIQENLNSNKQTSHEKDVYSSDTSEEMPTAETKKSLKTKKKQAPKVKQTQEITKDDEPKKETAEVENEIEVQQNTENESEVKTEPKKVVKTVGDDEISYTPTRNKKQVQKTEDLSLSKNRGGLKRMNREVKKIDIKESDSVEDVDLDLKNDEIKSLTSTK